MISAIATSLIAWISRVFLCSFLQILNRLQQSSGVHSEPNMSWKVLEAEVRFMIQEIQNTQERAVWDPEEDEWRATRSSVWSAVLGDDWGTPETLTWEVLRLKFGRKPWQYSEPMWT